jgi:hypothetical protein
LRRLVGWVVEKFGRRCCRETIRRALHRLELSWKKARKLLGRADPQRRLAFVEQVQDLLAGAQRDRHRLVYLDEAHIHQDADLGYGWSARGQRFWIGSHSPRLADKLSFYGLYLRIPTESSRPFRALPHFVWFVSGQAAMRTRCRRR